MTAAACIDCEYAEPLHTSNPMFRCRRYAPRPSPGGVEPSGIVWPLVAPEDWCGEFLERDSMAEAE